MLKKYILLFILLTFFIPNIFQAADEESLAQQAEQAGRLREALTHYVAALQSAPEGSTKDKQLREKIIKLVQKLTPPPIIPDEARRFAVRGQMAMKEAKNLSDYFEAAKALGKAVRLAPWWADGYFNQAVALEKAEKFDAAIRSLKFYLLSAPNAPDAEKVKDQIYALEYKQEKAQKEISTKRQAEEQERQRVAEQKALAENLMGRWKIYNKGKLDDYVDFLLIEITGDRIEIKHTGHITIANHNQPIRYRQKNLLIFSGSIQGNQIEGTIYVYRNYPESDQKAAKDLTDSDFYVFARLPFKDQILWDAGGNSFTAFNAWYYEPSIDRKAKWERGWDF